MRAFLTKGLTETAPLWSDIEQGYAWVYKAAHLLSNDGKQTAAEVCQAYGDLLANMEHAPMSSQPLATMLSTFRKVTASYWPGLFHCYDDPDLPRTNNELEQYLAQPAIMNDEQPGVNKRHQGWSFAARCASSPPLLPACILFLGLNCVRQI